MKVKEESENTSLKGKNMKIMTSSYITSWQIDGEKMETFLGSKITLDGDCSQEIKRCLPFGRKAMTNLDSILKIRHYFANKSLSSQSYGFTSSHCMDVRVGPERRLGAEESVLSNCGVAEDS